MFKSLMNSYQSCMLAPWSSRYLPELLVVDRLLRQVQDLRGERLRRLCPVSQLGPPVDDPLIFSSGWTNERMAFAPNG